MNIEIITREGELITSFELESNPFKVGESIYIDISNNDEIYWGNINEINSKQFKIDEIEHISRQIYSPKQKYAFMFTVSVKVTEI